MKENKFKIEPEQFIQEALLEKYEKLFAEKVEDVLLNQKQLWIGDIGYLTSEIKHQGTKSGTVIKNVKIKFVPSSKFRKKINNVILGK